MKINFLKIFLSMIFSVWLSGCATTKFSVEGPKAVPKTADLIVVDKSQRKLTLYRNDNAIKTYRVALGKHPVGPKTADGDGKTPEGRFCIDSRIPNYPYKDKNGKKHGPSRFHLALHISYPQMCDGTDAPGLSSEPGGAIMIHGIENGFGWAGPLHRLYKRGYWTDGCIGVTNSEIEEIWNLVPNGTPIDIRPNIRTVARRPN